MSILLKLRHLSLLLSFNFASNEPIPNFLPADSFLVGIKVLRHLVNLWFKRILLRLNILVFCFRVWLLFLNSSCLLLFIDKFLQKLLTQRKRRGLTLSSWTYFFLHYIFFFLLLPSSSSTLFSLFIETTATQFIIMIAGCLILFRLMRNLLFIFLLVWSKH